MSDDLQETIRAETLKLATHPQLKGLSPTQFQLLIQLLMSVVPQIINIFNSTPPAKQ